ncbi:DUF6515 family protein [Fischerella sp. PCC 9605]|uniref:DUF6515 family protein n=1 Tax=Fischerella sp. PCC 9605 TaxID=1173024 RepID=UPI0004AF9AC0|nr:DUF6515 family protein [Fischerella sp. PCC 9605]
MKKQTQPQNLYLRVLSSILCIMLSAVTINEIAIALPRGGGGFGGGGLRSFRGSFGSRARVGEGSIRFSGDRQLSRPSSSRNIQNRPQINRQQAQQRVQEIKTNPQAQQQVQQARQNLQNNPQVQQQVQQARQNLQNNPQAQQKLQNFQQSHQDFKIQNREDWQNYLDNARESRQDFINDIDWDDWNHVHWDDDDFWGWYYPPGYFAVTLPLTAITVASVANTFNQPYYYDRGVYYTSSGNGYTVAPAPVGAKVSNLPEGFITIQGSSYTYYYYLGTFYLQDSATDNYIVVPPPVGAVVPYIPGGYKKVTIKGTEYYQYAGTYYRPTYANGQLVYQVTSV